MGHNEGTLSYILALWKRSMYSKTYQHTQKYEAKCPVCSPMCVADEDMALFMYTGP